MVSFSTYIVVIVKNRQFSKQFMSKTCSNVSLSGNLYGGSIGAEEFD